MERGRIVNILDTLVKYVVETSYEDLPVDVIEATKKQFLDTLAAAIGGSKCSLSDELERLVDMVKDWGGKEESSILAFGGRVPAPNAAFVNGILCVRLDFDDTFAVMVRNHPSRSVVPVALAMAERQGRVNGKQLITALALGHDLECRMKLAVGPDVESPFGFTTNFMGAAATAGKLLRLNEDKLRSALGITFHQISGAKGGMGTAGAGASLKGLNNGIAAKSGIISALLAEKGFTSNWDFLDYNNKNNFYQVFYNGLYWPSMILLDLGRVFMGTKTSLKEFPCCHGQHPALELVLALVRKYHIKAEDVEKVQLDVSPVDFLLLADPIEKKQNPENNIETQFSLCWGVASAIIYGEVEIRNFTKEALRNTKIREIAHRVYARPDITLAGPIHSQCVVKIWTKNNKLYEMKSDQAPLGRPDNPLNFSDIETKFRQCCEYSVKPISEENQNSIIKMVAGLEEVSDVAQIVRLQAQ
jgi:2-methylcitrate dehydratase PrpD